MARKNRSPEFSFAGEGNLQRKFGFALHSFSTDTTAGGRASLRMEVLVFGVLSGSSPFTSQICLVRYKIGIKTRPPEICAPAASLHSGHPMFFI